MKIFILCFSLFLSIKVHAVGLAFGTYVPTANRYQDAADGSRDAFQINPYFAVNHYFKVFENHFFTPELGMAFHSGTEDEYSKRTTVILWHAGWRFTERLVLRYGMGTFWTRISGDGEEVELPNGTSTATFYAPTESSTSYNSTLDLGIEFVSAPNTTLRFDFFFVQPFKSNERALSYLLSMVYVP